MDRDATQRYPTALDLARDLECWLADQPVRAYREPLYVRVGRWMRQRKPLVTGVATGALLLLVALIIWRFAAYHRKGLVRQQVTDRPVGLAADGLLERNCHVCRTSMPPVWRR